MLSYSSSRVLPPKYIHPHIYTHSLLQLRLYKAAHNYLQYTLFLRFCQYALRARQIKRFHNAYRIVKPLYHTICSYVSHYRETLFPAVVTRSDTITLPDLRPFPIHIRKSLVLPALRIVPQDEQLHCRQWLHLQSVYTDEPAPAY